MQSNRQYVLYYFIITLLLFCVAAGTIFIFLTDYDTLIRSVMVTMNKNGLEEKVRSTVFPRQRFVQLQYLALLILLISVGSFWLASRYKGAVISTCKLLRHSVFQAIESFKLVFWNNSRHQNISLIGLFAIVILFYTHFLLSPFMTYDEMWSYNYYTANRFYYSFFTYSSYPLFELTTHFFKWLPFPMHVNLRLSPFIFGIACFFLFYACSRKYFGSHFIAMAGVAAFSFMPFTVFYFANARGVMHELFFAIAGLFSLLFWLNDTRRRQWLVIYCIAAVLGLYSMTTHILFIAFLTLSAFIFLVNKQGQAAWLFVKMNALAFICFMVLYLPILLVTGRAVYADVIDKSNSFKDIIKKTPSVMGYVLMDYTGRSYISLGIFLLAIPALAFLRKKLPANFSFLVLFSVCLPLSLLFFFLITRFIYAGRSVAYGALSVPLFTCLFLRAALPWLNKYAGWRNCTGLTLLILIIGADSYCYYPVAPINKYVMSVSSLLLSKHVSSCYDNSKSSSKFYNYYPAIEYYYRLEHKPFEFTLAAQNSIRHKPLLPEDNYDCIVYDMNVTDSSRILTFYEMYRDPEGKFKILTRNGLK